MNKKLSPEQLADLIKKIENSSLDQEAVMLIEGLILGQQVVTNLVIKLLHSKGGQRRRLLKELARILEVESQKSSKKNKEETAPDVDQKNPNPDEGKEKPTSSEHEDSPAPTGNENSSALDENEGKPNSDNNDEGSAPDENEEGPPPCGEPDLKNKPHPQRKNDEYNPVRTLTHTCAEQGLPAGSICPECGLGKLYPFREKIIPILIGQAPLVYEEHRLQILRCNACGALFEPKLPAEVPKQGKATPSAQAILALLHYEMGVPFKRLEFFQEINLQKMSSSQMWAARMRTNAPQI